MAITTISISNTFSDILTYTLANFNYLDVQKKYSLITFDRDISLASSTVTYGGLTFTPSSVILFCAEPTSGAISLGIYSTLASGYNSAVIYTVGSDFYCSLGVYPIVLYVDASNVYRGLLNNITSTGFDIVWYKANLPTGTATCIALCIR